MGWADAYCYYYYASGRAGTASKGSKQPVPPDQGSPHWVRCGTDISYFQTPNGLGQCETSTGSTSGKSSSTPRTAGSKKKKKGSVGNAPGASGLPSAAAPASASPSTFFSMTFTHVFARSSDLVYFAFSHPYTYTDLQRYLHKVIPVPSTV